MIASFQRNRYLRILSTEYGKNRQEAIVIPERRACMDVSATIDVSSASAVASAVNQIGVSCYADWDSELIDQLITDCESLYTGNYPGYLACDVGYHDLQHVLDVTLAMARLMAGYEFSQDEEYRFGVKGMQVGIIAALFHDAGYIRAVSEAGEINGGTFTQTHVDRSALFVDQYLVERGLSDLAPLCHNLVYFTALDVDIESIELDTMEHRELGYLLGTADMIAQFADVDYIRKCRDDLYNEFLYAGLAGPDAVKNAMPGEIIYQTPDELLRLTPGFMRHIIAERLGVLFGGVYRYAEVYFSGKDFYMAAITDNIQKLENMLDDFSR